MKQMGRIFLLAVLFVLPLFLFAGCSGTDTGEGANRPAAGDTIAVLTMSGGGTVKVRLLSDEVPDAVAAFGQCAAAGGYAGVSLTGQDAWLEASAPQQWSGGLPEGSASRHVTGALSLIHGGSGAFRIVDSRKPISYVELADYVQRAEQRGEGEREYSSADTSLYQQRGGAPQFDRVDTVVGYVYEGMNVVSNTMKQGGTIVSIEISVAS